MCASRAGHARALIRQCEGPSEGGDGEFSLESLGWSDACCSDVSVILIRRCALGQQAILSQFEVAEVIKRADNGMTTPFLCRMTNGETFYVKGRQATARGLIAEVISAVIGRQMGLPIPEIALVSVPNTVLAASEEAADALGEDWCFGSKNCEHLVELSLAALKKVPLDFQRRLFLFDYWIENEDRTRTSHGGNPNVFLDLGTSRPVVIDHNLAFDPAFQFERNRQLHICAPAWFTTGRDLFWQEGERDKMKAALDLLDPLSREVPSSWLERYPSFWDYAEGVLHRLAAPEFWEQLQ